MFNKNHGTQIASFFASLSHKEFIVYARWRKKHRTAIRKQRQLKHKYNGETVKWKKSQHNI